MNWTLPFRLLCDTVVNFQANQEEISLIVSPEKITFKNYVDDEPGIIDFFFNFKLIRCTNFFQNESNSFIWQYTYKDKKNCDIFADPSKVVHTALNLDPDEFDNCQIGVDTNITFCLKEFRVSYSAIQCLSFVRTFYIRWINWIVLWI